MPDDTGEFNRSVTLYELKLLSQETNHKIDGLAEKLSGLVTSLGEMRVQVNVNTSEIDKVRTHFHDLTNKVQVIQGKSEILSTDNRRDLAQLLPDIKEALAMLRRRGLTDVMTPEELAWVQITARELKEDNIKVLAANLSQQKKRDVRWFGLSREFVIGAIGIPTLILANNGPAIWHALFH